MKQEMVEMSIPLSLKVESRSRYGEDSQAS